MSKGRATWVDTALVHARTRIGICTSAAQYRAECKKLGAKASPDWLLDAEALCRVYELPDQGTVCLVCIAPRGKRTRAAYAALIVHEATHVWQQCREGLSESAPSVEFEAYSLQSICQNLFEAVGL